MIFKKVSYQLMLCAFVIVSTFGCMKTELLENGITKVPSNSRVYKNKIYFQEILSNQINTKVIFEKYDSDKNTLLRLGNDPTKSVYGAYRFYSNGCFNYFVLRRGEKEDFNTFNPNYNGKRGVYFEKNNRFKYDLFAEMNGLGWTGKLTGTFTFSGNGDTLYVKRDVSKVIDIYIKRKIEPKYLDFQADW